MEDRYRLTVNSNIVENPILSPDFTVEDIHKIREYNYEVTNHMTVGEKLLYYNTPRTNAKEQIERLRAKHN